MNKIVKEIQKIMAQNMAFCLPHVKKSDLEKNGAVFYMNGNNGTEFDWYVNDRLPAFMVFYNDADNLGAAKLMLFPDGNAVLYLYDEKGKRLLKEVSICIEAEEADIAALAAILRNEADDKGIWDADVEDICTDIEPGSDMLREFTDRRRDYMVWINRREILALNACVSKRITEEGWKVGYMERQEPCDEKDSGWVFTAGNEDDEYCSDYQNISLLSVGAVWQQLDSDIFKYIDMPVGTRLIRISPESFEIDKNDKEIYTMKR